MELISVKYSIPYVAFLLFLVMLAFVEFRQMNKNQEIRYLRYIVIISFSLFFGLKGFAGRDTFNYYYAFNYLPTIWNWSLSDFNLSVFEVGFKAYMVLLKSISPNFIFFSFISVLIDALILDVIIRRYSKYYVFAFVVYIAFYGQVFEMEQIRNTKAVLLFFLSLKYVEQNRFLPYLFLNLIGFTFHRSAILYVVLYPFLNQRYSIYFYFTIFVVGTLLLIFQIEYIKPILVFIGNLFGGSIEKKVTSYIASELYSQNTSIFTLGSIERVVSYLIFCFFFYKKLIERDERNNIMINLFTLYFISYFYLGEMVITVIRVSALFAPCYMILYPNILYEITTKAYKQLMFVCLVLYACVRLSLNTKFAEYTYENVLLHKPDMEQRAKTLKRVNEQQPKNN